MRIIRGLAVVTGLAILLMGCGHGSTGESLERIYLDYYNALKAEDASALQEYVAADRLEELTGEKAAITIRMIKEFLPTGIKVVQTKIMGDKALLKVKGRLNDQKMTGEVEFINQGGKWKITRENWQVSLKLESGKDTFYAREPKAFIENPKNTPRVYQVLKGHQGSIYGITFAPDNKSLISAGYGDFTLRVWNIDSGEEISKVRTKNRVRCLVITPDGSTVLTADAQNEITSWALEEGILSNPRLLVRNAGDTLAVSPDGDSFVTTGYKNPLQLWDLDTGTLKKVLSDKTNLRSLVFSKSGKYLANGSRGNTFTLWETKKWQDNDNTIGKVSKDSDVYSIDISRDDRFLATGHMDSSIVIFDMVKGEEINNFYVPNAATMDVKFAPDCSLLATAQYNKTIYLWDPLTARKITELKGHSEAVKRLAFSIDGTLLASAGEDRQIVIWYGGEERRSGQVIPALSEKTGTLKKKPETMEVAGVTNLLKNPYANQGLQSWNSKGDVSVHRDNENNPYFAIKYSGDIWQDVGILEEDAERWVLLISLSSSERINRDGDQTGLPYLYGYLLNRADSNIIDAYLQGQNMKHSIREPNKWGVIWGIFQVPQTSGRIRLFLRQADGRYAQNGSRACFDEPGIYLFDNETEAADFAKKY